MSKQQNFDQASKDWSAAAAKNDYASTVEPITKVLTRDLLDLVQHRDPVDKNSIILDDGAGSGTMTMAILERVPEAKILATDIAPSMLDALSQQARGPNVSTMQLNALHLSKELDKESFSHVFSTFMIQFTLAEMDAVKEIHSILKPGGTMALAFWGAQNDVFSAWSKAASALDPMYVARDHMFEGENPWVTEDIVVENIKRAGFRDVRSSTKDQNMLFSDTEALADLWFNTNNPAAVKPRNSFKGDLGEARLEMMKVINEQYGGARGLTAHAIFVVATK